MRRPLALLAALGLALPALAEKLVVVRSRPHPAYEKAREGFEAEWGHKAELVLDVGPDPASRAAAIDRIAAARPEAILALGTVAAKLTAEAVPEAATVYCLVERPDEAGLSRDRATGLSLEIPPEQTLSFIQRALPGKSRIGLVYTKRQSVFDVLLARRAAPSLGLELVTEEISGTGEVPAALGRLAGKIDVLWILPDPVVLQADMLSVMLELSLARKIPIVSFAEDHVGRGVALALVVDPQASGRRAAQLARRLFATHRLSDAPPEPPATRVVVNPATLRKLGLALPAELSAGALQRE